MSYGYEQTSSAFMNYGNQWRATGQSSGSSAITVQPGWGTGQNGYAGIYDDSTVQVGPNTVISTHGVYRWPDDSVSRVQTWVQEHPAAQHAGVKSVRAAKHLIPREAWEA